MKKPAAMTREQVRRVDRLAVEKLAIPSIILMENAAVNAAAAIRNFLLNTHHLPTLYPSPSPAAIAIICGSGNNAGDGYAIARHLHNLGHHVCLYPAQSLDRLTGDAAVNATICRNMTLPIIPVTDPDQLEHAARQWSCAHLIVDALLGTGFHGNVRPPLDAIIHRVNALHIPPTTTAATTAGPRVVAIDIPSGLDCQTGRPSNATIHADLTVTFVAPKVGFDNPAAQTHLGRVCVANIGVPPELLTTAANNNA